MRERAKRLRLATAGSELLGGSWASHCQTRFFHFPLRDVRSHFRYRKSELGVRSFVSVSFTLQSLLLLLLVVVVVVVVVGVLSDLTRYTEFCVC